MFKVNIVIDATTKIAYLFNFWAKTAIIMKVYRGRYKVEAYSIT